MVGGTRKLGETDPRGEDEQKERTAYRFSPPLPLNSNDVKGTCSREAKRGGKAR
jgi:hypothetical protein